MQQGTPILVYDGDCAICRHWVAYWRELTHGRIDYRPYQETAQEFPTIPLEAFQRAIQLIEAGCVYSGAAAAFRVLRYSQGRTGWWWCYSRVPGFAAMSEWSYAFFAR